jgi:L-asparaginase
MLFKDSLDMDDKDRQKILKAIEKYEKILIVHGTDTMHQTAQFLASFTHHQTIVLTGAMQPFNINSIEACCNFSLSWQFLNTTPKKGVFIGMHGLVLKHHKIFKNRKKGIFQCKK